MAQRYYNSEETARLLGVTEDEIKRMAQRQELHGYRDGAQLKFKTEEVDGLAKQRAAKPPAASREDEGDVLLSELELGPSASGMSGTVIGGVEGAAASSADSDLRLSEEPRSKPTGKAAELDSKVMQFEELDLSLDSGLSLEDSEAISGRPSDSGLSLEDSAVTSGRSGDSGGSTLDLAAGDLEDDDVVLGGSSGSGSDITIGGDSGISLVDPADSGLSLEEPLGIADSAVGAEASLELGEDDMVDLEEAAAAGSTAGPQSDADFLLTPLEEAADEEDSESGSQVIALDDEEEAPTVVAGPPRRPPAEAMLEEDLGPEPVEDLDFGTSAVGSGLEAVPLAARPTAAAAGAPLAAFAPAVSEAQYTGWNVVSLSVCTVLLILVGMMTYDLMRNMWSWDQAFSVNSLVMDFILNLF